MKKYLFILILCFFALMARTYANEASSAPGGNSNEVPTGHEYNVSRMGIKVSLVDSNGNLISLSNPVVFWPYYESGDAWFFDDDISELDYTPTANHVKFNSATSYGGVAMGCFNAYGGITSNNCNLYVYLKKIIEAKDNDLINFFVRKTLNLPVGYSIAAYTNYYLKFEPYYKVNYNWGGTSYVKFGTSYEIMYYIFDNNYPAAPLASVSNFIKSISSDTNFHDLTSFPVYYKGNDSVCKSNNDGDACVVVTDPDKLIYNGKTYREIYDTWLARNWLNDLALSNLDRYKLTYYYVNYSKPSSQQSGLGVGYIRIRDIVTGGGECVDVFRANMTMPERISLYKAELTKNHNYTNLLNKNITDATQACKVASCSYSDSTGCLSASIQNESSFNANNLSCYNETIDAGGKTAYCLTKLNLYNSFGTLGSISKPFTITSGRPVFNRKIATSGILNRVCYLYGGTGTRTQFELDHENYVESFKYLNDKFAEIKASSGEVVIDGVRYEDSVKLDFIAPSLYADNISGIITYDNKECSTCKFLGYGIISKLNENGAKSFTPILKTTGILGDDERNLTCHYSPNRLLIDSELRLKFRIIDTTNPFPGPEALGRNVGSNWCDAFNCENDNEVVQETIIAANDSYNKTGEGPKYSIVLTPDDIRVIREYNKKTTYDDYNFSCSDSGYNCESNFLKGLIYGDISYNAELIGTVSNKLIIN